jgi:hypothetical protein
MCSFPGHFQMSLQDGQMFRQDGQIFLPSPLFREGGQDGQLIDLAILVTYRPLLEKGTLLRCDPGELIADSLAFFWGISAELWLCSGQ